LQFAIGAFAAEAKENKERRLLMKQVKVLGKVF